VITLKSPAEIELMKQAGRIVWEAHESVRRMIRPGVCTGDLDKAVEECIRDHGATPSFKGYHGYPASACVSVNEEVVHGIPSKRQIMEGDIVSVDIGAIYEGYHGDAARTHGVGKISTEAARLIAVTEESFWEGIKYAKEGFRISDISAAVQRYVEERGFSVVRDLTGHGIGCEMHEDPPIPNFGAPGKGPRLKAGMTLAIEPMINAGGFAVSTRSDGWTVVTRDGRSSAHYENTIVITDGEPMVLTMGE
jgi:methionyl aminopeptidase